MARKSSGKPWLHGASGWWCATIGGKRKKLDKDYKVACRKLKARLTQAKRGDASGREWLDATFSELADEYLDHIKATKKPGQLPGLSVRNPSRPADSGNDAPRVRGPQVPPGQDRAGNGQGRIQPDDHQGHDHHGPTGLQLGGRAGVARQQPGAQVPEAAGAAPDRGSSRRRSSSRLLRHSDRPFRRFLIALRLTGCRPGELRSLIWEWVDLERGLWIIPEHKTITRQREPRPRIIPLPRTVLMMCRWLARKPHKPGDHVFLNRHGRPYTKDCLVTKMDRIRERAEDRDSKAGSESSCTAPGTRTEPMESGRSATSNSPS